MSWGPSACGRPDYPAVYTKVSAVRDWIKCFCSAQMLQMEIIKAGEIPQAGNLYRLVCKCRRQIKVIHTHIAIAVFNL